MIWTSQLQVLFLLTVFSFSIFSYKEQNQSDFDTDHLVMSIFRVILCAIWKMYLYLERMKNTYIPWRLRNLSSTWGIHPLDAAWSDKPLKHLALKIKGEYE